MRYNGLIAGILTVAVLCALTGCADMKTAKHAYKSGDYETARKHWQELADFGLADAQRQLAEMYTKGSGVEQDYVKAAELLKAAAAQGDAKAYYQLARLYEEGNGVAADGAQADAYYQEAVKGGYDKAVYHQARMYARGRVVDQDLKKAIALYEESARAGYGRASYELAQLLEKDLCEEMRSWYMQEYHPNLSASGRSNEEIRAIMIHALYSAALATGVDKASDLAAAAGSALDETARTEAARIAKVYS